MATIITGQLILTGSRAEESSINFKNLSTGSSAANILIYNIDSGQITYTSSAAIGGGNGGTPGGSDTQIQYNVNGTTFGAAATFTYDYNLSSLQQGEGNIATGEFSHAQGTTTEASGTAAHAEGSNTIASGSFSHAEGSTTQAIGIGSHAEGSETIALGDYSHTEGNFTIASGSYQTVVGSYNLENNYTSLFIVGGGSGVGKAQGRIDAFTVDVAPDSLACTIMIPTNDDNLLAGSDFKTGSMYFSPGKNMLFIYNGVTWKKVTLT
jgi:hypothetical protein